MSSVVVGAAVADITPASSQFLFGYPHVARYSEGVHDPILSSALYVHGDSGSALFIANDIIFVDKALVGEVRERIHATTGVPRESILISATHTHSGPIVVSHASNRNDSVVPDPDPEYRRLLSDQMARAAADAVASAQPASLGFGRTHVNGVGTNRRNKDGPQDREIPIVVARDRDDRPIACMLVYSMHPTVLHEDSRLISGDFPAFTRRYLQEHAFGRPVPIIYHNGTAGNQSPRYVARENTFAEAERLGAILGEAVGDALSDIEWIDDIAVQTAATTTDLPRKRFPEPAVARERVAAAEERLESLRNGDAPRQLVRTAETDWFGATEVLAIAETQAAGELEAYYRRSLPAEVQVIAIGPFLFVAWPGELFVEYGLELKRRVPNAFGVTMANGELQGYVVTEEAAAEGGYEASNALFHWSSGPILVDTAVELAASLTGGL
jgi:hypothetical protein